MAGYATLLAISLIIALSTEHCTAQKGSCYKKYHHQNGCRSKDRDIGKVKKSQCCAKYPAGGFTLRGQDRDACTPCTKTYAEWGKWDAWSQCSATCGDGAQNRTRQCNPAPGQRPCRGRDQQTRKCNLSPCPIHGGWSDWSDWTACSVTCRKGVQYQQRKCDNPAPKHGGKECSGTLEKSRRCELSPQCPIDGGWGSWGQWSNCGKTCGISTKSRTRPCDNPKPQYGGRPCNDSEKVDIDHCRDEYCVEDGGSASGSGSGSGGWGSGSGSGSGEESGGGWESSGSGSASGSGDISGDGSGSGSGDNSGDGSGSGASGSGSSDRGSRRRKRSPHGLFFGEK